LDDEKEAHRSRSVQHREAHEQDLPDTDSTPSGMDVLDMGSLGKEARCGEETKSQTARSAEIQNREAQAGETDLQRTETQDCNYSETDSELSEMDESDIEVL
jgi:hypothetical protein